MLRRRGGGGGLWRGVSASPTVRANGALQVILGQLERISVNSKAILADVDRIAPTEKETDPAARLAGVRSLVNERGTFMEQQRDQISQAVLDLQR